MHIIKEIKIGRLALAVFVTLLIADTVPHPNLSAGLVESSWSMVQAELAGKEAAGAIAELESNN